jgi:hypothetical protein
MAFPPRSDARDLLCVFLALLFMQLFTLVFLIPSEEEIDWGTYTMMVVTLAFNIVLVVSVPEPLVVFVTISCLCCLVGFMGAAFGLSTMLQASVGIIAFCDFMCSVRIARTWWLVRIVQRTGFFMVENDSLFEVHPIGIQLGTHYFESSTDLESFVRETHPNFMAYWTPTIPPSGVFVLMSWIPNFDLGFMELKTDLGTFHQPTNTVSS